MTELNQKSPEVSRRPSLLQNWLSAAGLIVAGGSLFAVVCLMAMDFFAPFGNPYMGILTYMVAPAFLVTGLALVFLGVALERRLVQRTQGALTLFPIIDLNRAGHRKALATLTAGGTVFLLLTAIGSYRSYHFTESVQFCGQTCHTVMQPEFTAYQHSPHARVDCVQCHIGPGAGWFVKSKLSGSYQVYSVAANKFPRPIPTPIHNLRPAQDTCEQCHWPQKFYGSVERVNRHFLADATNTPWTVRLLMKVGGGDPTFGPVGGIHFHMNISRKVEYIATDVARQKIPWVRVTDAAGKVTVYQTTESPLKPEQMAAASPRRMDCIDCHNRPAHNYNAPNRAVNISMGTGRIDPALPFIKKIAVELLIAEYKTTDEAKKKIAATLHEKYAKFADQAMVERAATELQHLYETNFFPEMKVSWQAYPNNIGHTVFPGCYRCHDGKHQSAEGQTISHNCNSCHTILAQGRGPQLETLSATGLTFEHPVDINDLWKEMNCAECHTGALAAQ